MTAPSHPPSSQEWSRQDELDASSLILPEKPDAVAEGVTQQETLPIGHISFHATLLMPERIETSVEFKLKDDLLAVLQDILK